MTLTITIVSDVVCPWCFIGKRRLETALLQFARERPDVAVAIRWLPYFLNPDTPIEGEPYRPFLEKKFGGPERLDVYIAEWKEAGRSAGLNFAFDKIRLRANTLRAHRLIHRFQQRGDAETLVERLFSAHFLRGEHVGNLEILANIAAQCGDNRTDVLAYLATDEDATEVMAQAERSRMAGVSGVPYFIFDDRLNLSGAQAPDILADAIRQVIPQV